MANEDMNGAFLGGGSLEHTVVEGEIYLRSDQLAQLISSAAVRMALDSIMVNDSGGAGTAQFLFIIAQKVLELRSELLKREIEAVLPDLSEWRPADFED